ncbi:restriction endonuclease subunit S [Aeromonas veronii]|uniref:restriction endonuclease subunit S n=1 Tax=Aeromonas veronii TaxID=654 RepID=UPI001F29E5F5|nr:restriction endonuclease subunit S [Aeromonas veronii]MCF5857193.1 restriction endonuclease subunit S [Aeromonas veronii]
MKTGWRMVRLGELCKTSSGGTPLKSKKEYYEGGSIPWLLSGEVAQGEIIQATNFITQKGLENSSAKLFPPNTVLVAMYGATAGQVGVLRIEASTNQAVCGIFPNEYFVPEFLFYLLLSRKDELIAKAAGNAQPNISQQKIRDTLVPIVPLPDQQRIVDILDEAFEAIAVARANAEQNRQNARALFESYLQSVFSQRGNGWINKPLSELCDIKHGFAFKSEYFTNEGDYTLLTPGNFFETGGYRDRGDKQKFYSGDIPQGFLLEAGDLLVAMTEQAAGLLGSPIIVPSQGKFLHNQRLGLVSGKPGIPWLNEFFFHVFNTQAVRQAIHESASGAKVRHTSPTKIGAVTVAFPASIEEQKAIVATLDTLTIETQRLESLYQRKIAALDELKQSLLQQAFSGQL